MGELILGSALGLVAALAAPTGFTSTGFCVTCLPGWFVEEQHCCHEQGQENHGSIQHHKERGVFLYKTKMCANL